MNEGEGNRGRIGERDPVRGYGTIGREDTMKHRHTVEILQIVLLSEQKDNRVMPVPATRMNLRQQ